ncbi:hypothetical protein EV356DRAFT_579615 [Viridothelium virens]|uniref:U3 small nucleolar RNA-associated protein 10 n=1 Tax=Viridothelium virens TaxID=1048519 RepID=A0A6A6GZB9_VIRVR|nr:hypothetical protein EV356DRAFT_579615 [Viridothelium virens]
MTSLQKQLAQIASNSTQQLDLKAQRAAHSKSLLFDPKDAVTQSFDTIYQICQEGFQELCLLDSRFIPFSRNLFSGQSKLEDRTQMTEKENEELDAVLERFLGLVSGRLLLKPAHKAVEWLVRRFRIHEYNTQITILTFLPYHESHIFLGLLSILPANIPPTCRFLYPYIKSLVNPPRSTIVYTIGHNTPTFTAFNKYVTGVAKAGQHSSTLLAFWASIISQALNSMIDQAQSGRSEVQRRQEEDLLLRTLPVINDALTVSNVPELVIGCYMICTILATKGNLEDEVLDGMMKTISGGLGTHSSDPGLITLAVIAQERQSFKLPKAVVKHLITFESLSGRLSLLSQEYRVDKLALGLILGALKRSKPSDRIQGIRLGDQLLSNRIFDETQTTRIIEAFAEVVNNSKDDLMSHADLTQALSRIFETLLGSPHLEPLTQQVLQRLHIDLEQLEAGLRTPIRSRLEVPVGTSDEVTSSDVVLEENTKTPFADIVRSLPKHIPENASFLTTDMPDLFEQLHQVFFPANATDNYQLQFDTLDIWKHGGHAALSSFYIRLWSGPSPIGSRTKALELMTNLVQQSQSFDEQTLIPYLLHALADESPRVRRAALDLGLSMKQRSSEESKGQRESFRNALYGQAAEGIEWMFMSEIEKVMSVIAAKLHECALDASQISNVIEHVLRKPQTGQESEKSGDSVYLKSKVRTAFTEFLCSHVCVVRSYNVKLRLLQILGRVGKSISSSRGRHLQPDVRKWIMLPLQEVESICDREHLASKLLDRAYLGILFAKDDGALDLLRSAAQGGSTGGRAGLQQAAFNRIQEIWPSLSANNRLSMADTLLDWSLETPSDVQIQSIQVDAADTLRAISLSGEILTLLLDSIQSPGHAVDQHPAAKRRRTSRSGRETNGITVQEDMSRILRRTTFILDLVGISSSRKKPELLRSLFHVLDELQQYKGQADSDLSYLQTITITNITEIVDNGEGTLPQEMEHSVRADLLVDCLRTTSNPQVHNAALLLISSLAVWVPDRVLHSVMPIFTFMGSTLMRQSDEYSAHVVDTTVSRVVPPLLASLQRKNQGLIAGISELLLSFVAAYEHIPSHRRLHLFQNLLQTIGTQQSLFAVISMLMDRYSNDDDAKAFAEELLSSFSAIEQIEACQKCLELAVDALPASGALSQVLLASNEKTEDQIATSLRQILQVLAIILSSPQLKAKFRGVKRTNRTTTDEIRTQYHALLSKSIELSQIVKVVSPLQASVREMEAATLALPPVTDFIESAKRLLQEHSHEICRRALIALGARLDGIDERDLKARLALIEFLPSLIEMMQKSSEVAFKATAISCIGNILDKCGKKDLEAALSAAKAIASEQALGDNNDSIKVISLLTLAGMVEVLQDDFIPLLPQILSKGFQFLESTLSTDESNIQLHDAVFRMIIAVTDRLPFMLLGKHLDMALALCFRSMTSSDKFRMSVSRQEFTELLPKKSGPKELFSALDRTWHNAVQAGSEAIEEFLAILRSAISGSQNQQVVKNSSILFGLFLKIFDLRSVTRSGDTNDFSDERIVYLESLICDSVLAMVFKINDTIFRPFFVRLVESASENQAQKDVKILRSITLFSFCERLFDSLKTIVTKYSHYILGPAAQILAQGVQEESGERDLSILLSGSLRALRKSFDYDESEFWQSPSHCDPICEPLLSLLTSASFDRGETSEADPLSPDGVLIPTIVAFASASSSLEHHKTLNSHLLPKLRSASAAVRLAAVKTEQALTGRLGEDWLGMLPEMIPYISELQEDDDEIVEKEVHRWIQQIEGVLGESLDGMLQ